MKKNTVAGSALRVVAATAGIAQAALPAAGAPFDRAAPLTLADGCQ